MEEPSDDELDRALERGGSFHHESSALVLICGLLAIGHVRLRRIDGYKDIAGVVAVVERVAA